MIFNYLLQDTGAEKTSELRSLMEDRKEDCEEPKLLRGALTGDHDIDS